MIPVLQQTHSLCNEKLVWTAMHVHYSQHTEASADVASLSDASSSTTVSTAISTASASLSLAYKQCHESL
jgi:hypothetical protein